MKKLMLLLMALGMGALTSFGQTTPVEDVSMDKSFEDAGAAPVENLPYHLVPKYYKAGELVPEQPIALPAAKKEGLELARSRPTPLRRDCLNIIYTVDPIYSDGTITGAVKGTIVIKWNIKRRLWVFSYLKYQLVNIEQNTQVFKPEIN
jgi:hypothetical protein